MSREMNHKERQLSEEIAREKLTAGRDGVLAMHGDGGYPYCLPINYIYSNGAIYIHGAKHGYKIDALKANPKVGFSVTVFSEVAPQLFTNHYESVVVTGNAEFVENDQEKTAVMAVFVDKNAPDFKGKGMRVIEKMLEKVAVIKINIVEITGKSYH